MASPSTNREPSGERATRPRVSRGRGFWRLAKGCIFLLGVLVLVVTFTPLVPWWAHKFAGSLDTPSGDILVVLGAATSNDEFIPYDTYLRAQYAVRAWQRGGFKAVVVSGGGGNIPVARAVADLLAYHGVPRSAMRLEVASSSTRQNAVAVKPILDTFRGRIVLLTSDYHMFRARRVFARAGIPVVPSAVPDAYKRGQSWKGRWPAFLDLASESAKIVWYELRGWM